MLVRQAPCHIDCGVQQVRLEALGSRSASGTVAGSNHEHMQLVVTSRNGIRSRVWTCLCCSLIFSPREIPKTTLPTETTAAAPAHMPRSIAPLLCSPSTRSIIYPFYNDTTRLAGLTHHQLPTAAAPCWALRC